MAVGLQNGMKAGALFPIFIAPVYAYNIFVSSEVRQARRAEPPKGIILRKGVRYVGIYG
jgi:hypothetical protein